MRVNEPFAGINFVHGGLVFHVALLFASLIVIYFTEDEVDEHGFMYLINLFRWSHAVTILYRSVEFSLENSNAYFVSFIFTQKIFETLSMCFYFLTSVYTFWYLSHFDTFNWHEGASPSMIKMREWLVFEISCFLFQVFSAGIFLFFTQLRGICNNTQHHRADERHKADALAYYLKDILWFNLILVPIGIHIMALYFMYLAQNDSFEPMKAAYSFFMIFQRVLMLFFFLPRLDSHGRFRKISRNVSIIFTLFQLIGIGITITWKNYHSITASTAIFEVIVFIGQITKMNINMKSQEKLDLDNGFENADLAVENEINKKGTRKYALDILEKPKNEYFIKKSIYSYALYSMIHPEVIETWPKNGDYATDIQLSRTDREGAFQGAILMGSLQIIIITLVLGELDTDGWKRKPAVTYDILAFRFMVTFFLHAKLQAEIKNGLKIMKYVVYHPYSFRKFHPDYHEKIAEKKAQMKRNIQIQLSRSITLITGINADDEPEKQNDDATKEWMDQDEYLNFNDHRNDGLYIRVLYAFLIGFFQTSIGVLLEYMSFHSISTAVGWKIFKYWATMYALSTFDKKYTKSIEEHPMHALKGKKICQVYRRSMVTHTAQMMKALEVQDNEEVDEHDHELEDQSKGIKKVESKVRTEDEKKEKQKINDEIHHIRQMVLIALSDESPYHHTFVNILRFIYKFIRMLYVSFFFYFAPFMMLIYQYVLVNRHRNEDKYDI